MTEPSWLAVAVALAAEIVWGFIFLPRARRFYERPDDWCVDPLDPDIPPAVATDLAWREWFVLYHMPGVAVVSTAGQVFGLRGSLWSVVAVMVVTGGLYAAVGWQLSRHL